MMSIFEAIGFCWTVLCTLAMTFAVMWLAFRGIKGLCEDARAGMEQRKVWNRMFQEGVEK